MDTEKLKSAFIYAPVLGIVVGLVVAILFVIFTDVGFAAPFYVTALITTGLMIWGTFANKSPPQKIYCASCGHT